MSDDWPSHGEELARKAIELVNDRVAKLERQEITQDQAYAAIDAVYLICQGLIPWDDADLIYQVRNQLKP